MRILRIFAFTTLLCGGTGDVLAQQISGIPEEITGGRQEREEVIPEWAKFNLETPTLGGRQLWGDVTFFRGYRIQHNVLTNHYRLLDPRDVRLAWGTLDDCQRELNRIRSEENLAPMTGRAVIVVHGIIRSSKSFSPLTQKLKDNGIQVVGFDYPSTRVSLPESARYLEQTITSMKGIEQIDFVVHSMGGLLVRTYLQNTAQSRDPRLHRMVMLGVPNHGAHLASLLQKNFLFKTVLGPAGQQLVADPAGFVAKLPVPDFEFAVIAGIRGSANGWNPLIPGEDDGTVSLESTRLPGACDFMAIPSLHSTMMWNPDVMDATIRFLETGALRESGIREPIPSPGTDVSGSECVSN